MKINETWVARVKRVVANKHLVATRKTINPLDNVRAPAMNPTMIWVRDKATAADIRAVKDAKTFFFFSYCAR